MLWMYENATCKCRYTNHTWAIVPDIQKNGTLLSNTYTCMYLVVHISCPHSYYIQIVPVISI